MAKFEKMRVQLLKGEIQIKDLFEEQAEFIVFADKVIDGKEVDEDEFQSFLILCLDAYVFSDTGKVLIPDRTYDLCMEVWKINHDVIVFPDSLLGKDKTWRLIEHKHPGLVGTLPKVYEYRDLKAYLKLMRDMYSASTFIIAPKYDGISIAMKIKDGEVVQALTRYDGAYGQDITRTIQRAKLVPQGCKWLINGKPPMIDGYYKCEVCVSSEDFDELIKEKSYANRRSATSGIINTPTNIDLGRYLTIIPLMRWDPENRIRDYAPPGCFIYTVYSPRDLMDLMEAKLVQYRSQQFQYRVDGIVLWPISNTNSNGLAEPNPGNLMEYAMAFKVNTAEGRTTIEYCYFSVGKLGNAKPMAHVKPVEVNETVVTDVSLGSYERFKSLNLYEGEEVIIFSAGDVIPQLKKTGYANNVYEKPFIKIDKHCPYCGVKLTRTNTEYSCTNPNCIRIVSGRIANFASKIGIEGFADKTFEDFVEAKIIKTIPDLFKITVKDIASLPGYDTVSAENFINEVQKIRNMELQVSQVIGALGIRGISIKKCQKIFEITSLDWMLRNKTGSVMYQISNASGIGVNTAQVFCDFLDENREMIKELYSYLKIIPDIKSKGSFVFTGFRSPSWEKKFKELGYNPSGNVTGNTAFVIAANKDIETGNVKAAIKRGIPMYYYENIESFYDKLRYSGQVQSEELNRAIFD